MAFNEEYNTFIASHCKQRTGQRLERLRKGLGHSEKSFLEEVWWPAFKSFDGLHPQYEISDFRDGYRYIDFAYIHTFFRLAIEIDGLGPHWRNISKWQFSDHLQRQNHLILDGWYVLRFTQTDLTDNPRTSQQILHQFFGKMLTSKRSTLNALDPADREIVRHTLHSTDPITPRQAASLLHVTPETAVKRLQNLRAAEWLEPASGSTRIRSYRLSSSKRNLQL